MHSIACICTLYVCSSVYGGLRKRKVNECHHRNIDFFYPQSIHLSYEPSHLNRDILCRILYTIRVYIEMTVALCICACVCTNNSNIECLSIKRYTVCAYICDIHQMHQILSRVFLYGGRWWWCIENQLDIYVCWLWIHLELNTVRPPTNKYLLFWSIWFMLSMLTFEYVYVVTHYDLSSISQLCAVPFENEENWNLKQRTWSFKNLHAIFAEIRCQIEALSTVD